MKVCELKSLIKQIVKESMTTRAELDVGVMKAVNVEEAREMDVFKKHQLRIALQTLKMTDAGANIMGGMNKKEAREFLKRMGYSDASIQKLEGGLNEMSTTGGVAGYMTPKAFTKNKKGSPRGIEAAKKYGTVVGEAPRV